jgi:hypothetical protein
MNLVNISTDKMRDAMIKINANIAELEGKINNTEITPIYIEIGAWDMDTDVSKNVSYAIPANYNLIGYEFLINDDAGTLGYNETIGGNLASPAFWAQGNYSFANNRFELSRPDAAYGYNSADYSADDVNRGYIRVYLKPA